MTVAHLKERMDARFNGVDKRFNAVDRRFNAVDRRLDSIGEKLDAILVSLERKYDHHQDILNEHDDRIKDSNVRKKRKARPVPRWCEILAPPKTRGRKREARRWLDELTVRCTNGRVCERRPGARLLTFRESQAIHEAGFAELEATDPELLGKVYEIMWSPSAVATSCENSRRDAASAPDLRATVRIY